ncbi:MAG: TonB-dependent receptor, partial [Pseudomonadota bacterium]|nr:TonB-dependent receptor [Pseudomonadota bacterium]
MYILFSFAFSEEDLGTVEVISTSPLPGILIEKNKYPNTSQSISENKIKTNLSKTLVDMLNDNLSGVTVKDIQNGSFQKNLDYRGFTASPLLGESQGITVYLDGVRVNESFGDTVQWELIPEYAIKKVDLMSSNPAFGLNALGGAIVLSTKKGLDYKNQELNFNNSIKMGSYAYHSELFEFGTGTKDTGLYTSLEKASDGGWRDHSAGKISRFYNNFGYENENYNIELSILGADTNLNGNGVSPVELLHVDRASVFTWPDKTTNKVFMITGSGNYFSENDSILSTNIYVRRLFRNTLNADEVDAEECAEDVAADATELKNDYGFDDAPLCGEDNSTGDYGIILDQNGSAIESDDNIRKYGLLNKTFTTTTTLGGSLQYDSYQNFFNREHQLSVGTSIDYAKSYYRSGGFLGILNNERTVTPLNNSLDQPIELVAEQEHTGNGGDPGDKERGDVGPAEVTGKLNLYGVYIGDTFKYDNKTTLSSSLRANIAFVELIDNFKTNTYTRTAFVNGDHRYFRVNPSLGFVRSLNDDISIMFNYREANRAPSPVELACADPAAPCRLPNAFVADPPLEQVITRSFEAGIRGSKNFN